MGKNIAVKLTWTRRIRCWDKKLNFLMIFFRLSKTNSIKTISYPEMAIRIWSVHNGSSTAINLKKVIFLWKLYCSRFIINQCFDFLIRSTLATLIKSYHQAYWLDRINAINYSLSPNYSIIWPVFRILWESSIWKKIDPFWSAGCVFAVRMCYQRW